jgi:3-oxoacyl-[acyl-carrier protein] reductase
MLTPLFEQKLALVTGASRGIGHAIAQALGQQGATVIGTATTPEGAEKITHSFKEAGIAGEGFVLNLSDPHAIDLFLQQLKQSGKFPDILVNNAAITRDNLLLRMKDDEWESVVDTNLSAVYRLTKPCVKEMVKRRWGRIINLSSVVAFTGNPGQTNYSAAKAGLIGFTRSLAYEVASRNITVNAIAPGFIETAMTDAIPEQHKTNLMNRIPANRLGQPNDIAAAVVFLASPTASYITGQTLHVNGGMYMG